MVEQMDWQVPEHIIVPGGNLANSAPRSARASPRCTSSASSPACPRSASSRPKAPTRSTAGSSTANRVMKPVTADTRATAIRIGNPASWRKAAARHRRLGGWCEQVSEQEIALAKAEIGAEGVGCEPASAVTLAGLKKLVALGQDHARRARRPHPDRPHPQRLAIHHRLPPQRTLYRSREGPALRRATRRSTPRCASRPSSSKPIPTLSCARLESHMKRVAQEPAPARMTAPSQNKPIHLRLPATSANLGPGFDALGLAMALYLTIDATHRRRLPHRRHRPQRRPLRRPRNNLILTTYIDVLANAGVLAPALHLQLHNEIPLGMGCGSSAAALLAGVLLANHFGDLNWTASANPRRSLPP